MANMPDLTPDSASSFSDKLFEKTLSNATAVRGLDAEIMELRRQIDKLKDAKTGMTDVRAIVTIVADKAGPAQLRLTYRESSAQMFRDTLSTCFLLGVGNAEWRPLYDLYAYSQDGTPSTSVSLHYRVNLSQSTGEDWDDAKLILSASETDILNAGIPTSDGLVIEPKPESPFPEPMAVSAFLDVEEELSSSEHGEQDSCREIAVAPKNSLATVLPKMSEGAAVVSKSPMAVKYTVDELTTIPSDGKSHKVLVAIVPLEATISHITTPRKSPLAYLQVWMSPVSIHRPTYRAAVYSAR